MKDEYKRIGCSVYDRYESLAATRKSVDIVYLDDENKQLIKGNILIVDLYTVSKVEFMRLKDDTIIRLDKIISIAEIPT